VNDIAYSPRKVDLFYPAREANFFSAGLPATEAALCTEMARLAYCRFEPYFQFDPQKIRAVLEPLAFGCHFFESTGLQKAGEVMVFSLFTMTWSQARCSR
jgi:hypothetical protein